jgi:digalactosyldiacylglycerol synthase
LQVVLVVPFVPLQDQRLIFPEGVTCSTPQQQEAIIKTWAREHSGLQDVEFTVLFYAARYYPASRCIFATEDVCRLLPKEQVRQL